jgi:uncharacterized protein (TIGR02594 family)
MLPEPFWMKIARTYLGVREITGPKHEPLILKWWTNIKAPFRDDETPWCGAYVGGVLYEADLPIVSGGASARSWLKLKTELDRPAVGCVVIFWRGSKNGYSGHVGFVVGQDKFGNLMVLGGNQGNVISIKPFDKARVLGYRWPSRYPDVSRFTLPVLDSDGRVSTNEA